MIVNSAEFLWMFPLLFGLFLGLQAWRRRPPRSLNIFLLVASYALFWYYNKGMTAVLAAVTLVTYLGALATERYGKRAIAPTVILLALLPLAAFKYWNFIKGNLDALFPTVHLPGLNWAIPLGISFFTLQAVGYYHDVACKKIRAERNILDYSLFVSFFPQIASGPISRARDLLPQIKADRRFDHAQATQGLKWILWGAFLKMVVADNIGAVIAGPLAHSASYAAWSVSLSVVLYSIHIYCDFAGYSFMALGIGELLGFELVNNFRRPYLAVSVTDFWHRWHISLSTWLKEHIYIPLGGSRCPKWRNYLNILVTFLVSGLWHGASWTFIAWGGMHGAAQVAEKHLGLHKSAPSGWMRPVRVLLTFAVVTLAWVFFNSPTFARACATIGHMFASPGARTIDWFWPVVLAASVIVSDIVTEFDVRSLRLVHHRYAAVRWTAYSVLTFCIMLFAVYGSKFIYSGF